MDIEFFIDKYQLNQTEATVLRFMATHKTQLKKIGIREVAQSCYVSTSFVVSLAKKLGLSGYSELVFSMTNDTFNLNPSHTIDDAIRLSFVDMLTRYQDKPIMVLGSGFSQNIANYFSEYLNLYGFRATANSHLEYLRSRYHDNMLIIIVSSSGHTLRLLDLATSAKKQGIDIISFVGDDSSPIAKTSNLVIDTNTYSTTQVHTHAPNLFFGTSLNLFEVLMSDTLKSIYK